MRLFPRHLFSWKTWFYRVLLPILNRLGPRRADQVLQLLGGIGGAVPRRTARIKDGIERANRTLGLDLEVTESALRIAENLGRFVARDFTLGGLSDLEALRRFDVEGEEHLELALRHGNGLILLGSHFGSYIAGLHWLIRRRLPIRFMLQRPRHVSAELQHWFDDPSDGRPHPPADLLLRRDLSRAESVSRMLRARMVLRDGMILYINGDVSWDSGCARPGRFLGNQSRFLSAWADLSVITNAPVVPIFCRHRPDGRFAIRFDPPWSVNPGGQQDAVDRYLKRLETAIASEPVEAIAHLLWPSFGASSLNAETRFLLHPSAIWAK